MTIRRQGARCYAAGSDDGGRGQELTNARNVALQAESKEMSKRKHILPVFFFKFQESPKEVSLIRRTELHVHKIGRAHV